MSTWFALLCLALIGCKAPLTKIDPVRRSQPLLGTFIVITAHSSDRAAAHRAISAAFDEIRRVDSLMSLHRADSELARVNAIAANQPVHVSEDLFLVISNALDIAKRTDGSFDPTIAPLTQLWGFLWKEHRLPSPGEINPVLRRVNYKFVEIDVTNHTVRFRTNGVTLDLNAIAKGYAVDRAIETLRSHGITNAMVRAGGDLRVIGAPPDATAWTIQIEDPGKAGRRRELKLRDAALSTSGSYENYFMIDGRRYSHVLNPRTGMPVEGVASCTVIAPTCLQSDAWSTALFVLGPKTAIQQFGAQFPILFGLWSGEHRIRWEQSPSFGAMP